MTLTLRIVLILVSLLTLLFVMRKVRSSKIKLEDSMIWILFSGALLILSIFPGVFDFFAELAGVYSTVNFYFCSASVVLQPVHEGFAGRYKNKRAYAASGN